MPALSLVSPGKMALAAGAALAAIQTVPWRVAGKEADAWLADDPAVRAPLVRGVATWVAQGVRADQFATGSDRFDDEWVFGTCFMATLALSQLPPAERSPEWAGDLDASLTCLVSPAGMAFDTASWGTPAGDLDAILTADRGHAAYLGYLGLALAAAEGAGAGARWVDLGGRVNAELERRFAADPTGVFETYPGERYPVDAAMGIAALALHAKTTHGVLPEVVRSWPVGTTQRDRTTGLLVQSIEADGSRRDGPRGSGTLLAAYALGLADLTLAEDLYDAAVRELYGEIAGFGMMREYPQGVDGGGDIDSGPIVLGYGVSATGFALASARRFHDDERFAHLFATSQLFGLPTDEIDARGLVRRHATGGPLGDAILLAMFTAPRAEGREKSPR